MTHELNKNPVQETEGDTFTRDINFRDDSEDPIDITGWTIYVTVKRDLDDDDDDAVLSDDVTSHDNATNGETSFSFTASETEGLDTIYYFEVKYEDNSGEVNTMLQRRIEFNPAVRQQT